MSSYKVKVLFGDKEMHNLRMLCHMLQIDIQTFVYRATIGEANNLFKQIEEIKKDEQYTTTEQQEKDHAEDAVSTDTTGDTEAGAESTTRNEQGQEGVQSSGIRAEEVSSSVESD